MAANQTSEKMKCFIGKKREYQFEQASTSISKKKGLCEWPLEILLTLPCITIQPEI